MKQSEKLGAVVWRDLTVDDADGIRDFYASVVGWTFSTVQMGGYCDYNMHAQGDTDGTVGICHARGSNVAIPPQWLIYIIVANVDESAKKCVALGGEIIDGPRLMGKSPFCVIRDPAGAICALIEPSR